MGQPKVLTQRVGRWNEHFNNNRQTQENGMTNKLIEFRDKWKLGHTEAAVQLGVSLKTIYNNEREGASVSDVMLKRIELADEQKRRRKIRELSGKIADDCNELSQLTAT